MARGIASGVEQGAEKPTQGEYVYYKHDGAKFRRRGDAPYRSIDDILHGSTWKPYTGDELQPVVFGDRIVDPLAKAEPGNQEAGAPEQKPMMKAIVDRLLFRAPKK